MQWPQRLTSFFLAYLMRYMIREVDAVSHDTNALPELSEHPAMSSTVLFLKNKNNLGFVKRTADVIWEGRTVTE